VQYEFVLGMYFRLILISLQRPAFDPMSVHVGFVVEKWYWGSFILSTSVLPDL
jgi:hypothetical protein